MLRICSGRFKGKRLKLPPTSITRPSSDRLRQAVFNMLGNPMEFANARVLDGFAGSGVMGLEALSRGACEVVFCESNPLVREVLAENIRSTVGGAAATQQFVIARPDGPRQSRSLRYAREEGGGNARNPKTAIFPDFFSLKAHAPFDLIFLDPPYDQGLEQKALAHLLSHHLISDHGIVVVEQRKGSTLCVPENFRLLDQRIYGKCQVTFLHFILR